MNAPPIRRNRYANAGPQPKADDALSSGARAVDVLRILEQTDVALATAGLPDDNILRAEFRQARAAVAELIAACHEVSIYSRAGHAASAKRWRAALAAMEPQS